MSYWDRPTLKTRAKGVLSKSYWTSFAVSLVIGIISGINNFGLRFNLPEWPAYGWGGNWNAFWRSVEGIRSYIFSWAFVGALFGVGIVTAALGLLFSAFLSNILEVGQCRHYTMCRYGSIQFEDIIFGFKNGYYMSNVKTMFLRTIYIFLWALIPIAGIFIAIVKSLSYFMVPYIVAENPNLSSDRVLEISKRATDGEKGEMFVVYLSFIGWMFLCVLTCGIGWLFLRPYIEATKAELYGALRYKAVRTGICTQDELGAELELA